MRICDINQKILIYLSNSPTVHFSRGIKSPGERVLRIAKARVAGSNPAGTIFLFLKKNVENNDLEITNS